MSLPLRATAYAAVVLLAAAVVFFWSAGSGRIVPSKSWRYSFGAMGTLAGCTFFTTDPAAAEVALAAVQREFDRVTAACNLHDPDSELSRLNREAEQGWFVCSALLWEVLSEARRAHAAGGGAFDITVKPLMDIWGFYRRRNAVPAASELKAALDRTGLERLEWDEARRAVRFSVPGMAVDLGGIAKGYALDLAAAAVVATGVRSGVIDLGGNLFLLPEPPPGKRFYRVGIRSPSGSGAADEVLELPGGVAVSTSGSYERFVTLGGRRYGHVVDPETGEAPFRRWSVTVVAPSGIMSDWMSSAVFLRGRALASRLEQRFPGVRIVFASY